MATSGVIGFTMNFREAVTRAMRMAKILASGETAAADEATDGMAVANLLTSPDEYYREPNGRVGRYSFTGYRELHHLMTANGDGTEADPELAAEWYQKAEQRQAGVQVEE